MAPIAPKPSGNLPGPHLYRAYGLTIRTPFACLGLDEADPQATVDAEVLEGTTPPTLEAAQASEPAFDVTIDRFLYRGGLRSARFLVEDGARITFQRREASDDEVVQHDLFHSAMAALLRQRGVLVLHASAAAKGGDVVAICGVSGAGKSTAAAALAARGWRLLSDDLVALRGGDGGGLHVSPGPRSIHLDLESTAALGLPTDGLEPRDWHRGKFAVPFQSGFESVAPVLRRLAFLTPGSSSGLVVSPVAGVAKLPFLLGALYGPTLPEQLMRSFELFADALAGLEMVNIRRPMDAWCLDAIVTALAAPVGILTSLNNLSGMARRTA